MRKKRTIYFEARISRLLTYTKYRFLKFFSEENIQMGFYLLLNPYDKIKHCIPQSNK
jgi:hypothetical protein